MHGSKYYKYHVLLAEDNIKEVKALPYFQDTVQHEKHG